MAIADLALEIVDLRGKAAAYSRQAREALEKDRFGAARTYQTQANALRHLADELATELRAERNLA